MTDMPILKEALIQAARRRRRRARLGSGLVTMTGVVLVVALMTQLSIGSPEREVAATATQPGSSANAATYSDAREAADHFAVLREDSNLSEVPPVFHSFIAEEAPGDVTRTYLAHRDRLSTIWMAVGTDVICIMVQTASGAHNEGCVKPDSSMLARGTGPAMISTREGLLLYALLPDGTKEARIHLVDGSSEAVSIQGNLAVFNATRQPTSMSWTTPEGRPYSVTTEAAEAHFVPRPTADQVQASGPGFEESRGTQGSKR